MLDGNENGVSADEPSSTARFTAMCRGRHRREDAPPWVLDDTHALDLIGPGWTGLADALDGVLPEPARSRMRAGMVARSRYVEDRLLAGHFGQYVLLGAGLDTFAWRRPDLLGGLRVYEVDHPATLSWKWARAAELGWPVADGHVFTPIDLEHETLGTGLDRAGFDWSAPACFAWLGVTQYLTRDAVLGTLETIAACPPGTEIVFTYVVPPELLDDVGRLCFDTLSAVAARSGETWHTVLRPDEAHDLVEQQSALTVREHLGARDMHERYFADRADGLTPYSTIGYIAAGVPS